MKCKYVFEKMEIDDQIMAVPLNTENEEFHGVLRLNETAAAIIDLLQEETTEEDIIENLLKAYEGDRNEITSYVQACLEQLKEAGIVE